MKIKAAQSIEEKQKALELRHLLLRMPLGLPKGSETDEFEESAYTLIAFNETSDEIIGTGRIHCASDHTWQVRYMAVKQDTQQKGVGKQILKKLEDLARINKASEIILNARNEVKEFYAKNGYHEYSEPFTSLGICHVSMKKKL